MNPTEAGLGIKGGQDTPVEHQVLQAGKLAPGAESKSDFKHLFAI